MGSSTGNNGEPRRLLIVRSVSVQQLDGSIEAIRQAYPGYALSILTHPHAVEAVEKYPFVERVYRYRHQGPFRYGRGLEELRGEHFDLVVVPVANPRGGGFFNVFLFSLSLPARRRVVWGSDGTVRPLGRWLLLWMGLTRGALVSLTLLAALPVMAVSALGLPWLLKRLERKE